MRDSAPVKTEGLHLPESQRKSLPRWRERLRMVPGILMNTFGRAARRNNSFVDVTVVEVLCASKGETSIDTQPSTPSVRSYVGRNKSAACVMSSSAKSKKIASVSFPLRAFLRIEVS